MTDTSKDTPEQQGQCHMDDVDRSMFDKYVKQAGTLSSNITHEGDTDDSECRLYITEQRQR